MSYKTDTLAELEEALHRMDNELHGANYELYVYLHDVISSAINQIKGAQTKPRLAYDSDGMFRVTNTNKGNDHE